MSDEKNKEVKPKSIDEKIEELEKKTVEEELTSEQIVERAERRRRRRRKKLMKLALLLLLLNLLVFSIFFFLRHKELPLVRGFIGAQRINPPVYLFSIYGPADKPLVAPIGVAVNKEGDRIYVTDPDNRSRRVEVFDFDGNFLYSIENLDSGRKLWHPVYVAVNSKDEVYVSDRRYAQVFVFDSRGKFLRTFYPNGDPKFKWAPFAMTFDKKDNLYVVDIGAKSRVLVFDTKGNLILQFGRPGATQRYEQQAGELVFPNGLAVDKKGNIWVADSNNSRLQVFNNKGELVRTHLVGGLPRGIAIDDYTRDEKLLVVDVFGHNVNIYNTKAERLTTFGERGVSEAQFNYPNGLALGYPRRIYITDRVNGRVQVWTWGGIVAKPVVRLPSRVGPLHFCLLPLLLLPLWLLLRRVKYVAHRDFIEALLKNHKLPLMRDKLKKIYVTAETFNAFERYKQDEVELRYYLKPKDYDDYKVDQLQEDYLLEREGATVIAIARERKFFKLTVLAEDKSTRKLAEHFRYKTMNCREFIEKYTLEDTGDKPTIERPTVERKTGEKDTVDRESTRLTVDEKLLDHYRDKDKE